MAHSTSASSKKYRIHSGKFGVNVSHISHAVSTCENWNFKNFERSKILQRKTVYKILDSLTETRLRKARNRERV